MKSLRNASPKVKSTVTEIGSAVMFVAMNILPAYADISTEISGGLKKVYDILAAIVLPVAAIAAAVCAIKMIWGDARAAETAKATLIRIVIGVALVFLAPFLIDQVGGWFKGKNPVSWW